MTATYLVKLRSLVMGTSIELAVFLTVSLFINAASATTNDDPIIQNPLTATAIISPLEIGQGGTGEVLIEIELVPKHHAYLERFNLQVEEPDGLKLGAFRITPISKFLDSVSGQMKEGIEGKAQMRALIEIPESFKIGTYQAEFALTYQACTAKHCLFPKTLMVKTAFTISTQSSSLTLSRGNSTQSVLTSAPPPSPPSEFEKALGKGLVSAFGFVFLIGFLTSLTPCIYPMIPITLAVLGTRSAGQSRLKSFLLSCVYVLGIATTYSGLGVLAATTGALFGSALGNIWVVTALSGVFVLMGLSMYGLFDVQVPAFLRDRLGGAKTTKGFGGAFATGLIAGIVASPCIGPVLVSILAFIANTRSVALGSALLFTFALGMGVLFLILGAFSHLISHLPKAGAWMDFVKFVFGSIMMGMAVYYVGPLYPRWLILGLSAVALVLISAWHGALAPTGKTRLEQMKKAILLLLFVAGLGCSLLAIADRAGFVGVTPMTQKDPTLAWQPYSEKAFSAALTEHRPILIDFTAAWCGACQELVRDTFSDPRVRDFSSHFQLLTVDATEENAKVSELKDRFKVLGLPTLLFFDRSGHEHKELTVTGFENADAFLMKMKAAESQAVH